MKLLPRGTAASVTAFGRPGNFYGLFLEKGAETARYTITNKLIRKRNRTAETLRQRVLKPRPFLTTALEAQAPTIEERVKAAVLTGMKFQRASGSQLRAIAQRHISGD
jgi:hypothetical protein